MPRSAAFRYCLAALALGAIATWGSEMFFWSAPRAPVEALDLLLTLIAYSLASAAALSAVLLTGAGGWAAAFLGGCLMGWLVEGVVVAETYDAFPFQLVWTPMAWHGVITGGLLIGAWRAAQGRPLHLAGLIVGLMALGALWALYWPIERGEMPGLAETGFYLVGLSLAVPLGHLLLDRLGHVERPSPVVLAVAPALFAVLWAIQLAVTLDARMLALPVVIGLTVLVMRGLGRPDAGLDLGSSARPASHFAFMAVPLGVTLIASLLWPITAGLATNGPIALVTALSSLVVLGGLAWRGVARSGIVAR